ncbi:host attachment protein [Sulfitobacter mediterraneus]|uniref:host attachment family protein n=1 Tax=Sulfitobacter mediterraneus TaxID=83219 RepID=UPI001932FDC1|nr:host attachment family protein [Sulfitobacter mediterraneus]MBM1311859.1 host attachment protein [Sulfitobacter mediterraneus]MBM1315740.1 host attachment protein [Sulfitobacter mediterraneus]MBM1324102.1 host attachment protein [Sulfitobacter mediterraneus]MBM1328014.1 host attachment protein [Sulfitobacter mediterraneus]MBM1399362.1 host attachment protein [Sulfitobacter mediterraneus]
MTQIDNGTWVLIADGEKALFLENKTDGQDPFFEVFREEEQDNPPNREQAANRPGRFNDGPSVHRSAVADTDWHELAKDRFAHDLAGILYKQAHKGRFSKLVIVAPPNTLGELRQELHQEVTQKVIGEVPKTLTNHPIDEIEKIVSSELAAA